MRRTGITVGCCLLASAWMACNDDGNAADTQLAADTGSAETSADDSAVAEVDAIDEVDEVDEVDATPTDLATVTDDADAPDGSETHTETIAETLAETMPGEVAEVATVDETTTVSETETHGGWDDVGFHAAVQEAYAGATNHANCGFPLAGGVLPADTSLADAVAQQLEDKLGATSAKVVDDRACGTSGTASCANSFQFDVYSEDGVLGEALYPLAQTLEAYCKPEVAMWDLQVGESAVRAATIACVIDGHIAGIGFIVGLRDCEVLEPL